MPQRSKSLAVASIIAGIFGLLTIVSGGKALLDPTGLGAVVPFVLWFNFAAGFGYVAAAVGLWQGARWAAILSLIIAAATAAVFAALLWHISQGGAFEWRTIGAMALRLAVWSVIAGAALRSSPGRPKPA